MNFWMGVATVKIGDTLHNKKGKVCECLDIGHITFEAKIRMIPSFGTWETEKMI